MKARLERAPEEPSPYEKDAEDGAPRRGIGTREENVLLVETLFQDVRHTFRRLRKSPAFIITTVLLLALGIGATTAIFTLVYAILFKSLAVANPGGLYRLGKQAPCCNWPGSSQADGFSMVRTASINTSEITQKCFPS
jgi:hypothetical protein